MLECLVGEAGNAGQNLRAGRCDALNCQRIEPGKILPLAFRGFKRNDAFAGATHMLKNGEHTIAETAFTQQCGCIMYRIVAACQCQ